MNWTQIYNRGLKFAHTNALDYSTTLASEDMELRHQDLVDRIVSVTKGDYFWDLWQTNTVVNQSEYGADKLGISPDDLDIKKINKVFVKYKSTDAFPARLSYVSPNTLEYHPDWYKVNQTKENAFFYILDESIFIFPAPTEAIVWALELFVIHKPAAIDTDTTEDNIEIPSQFHRLISLGLAADILYSQWDMNWGQLMESKYEQWIQDMISFMKARYNQPKKRTFTDLERFR